MGGGGGRGGSMSREWAGCVVEHANGSSAPIPLFCCIALQTVRNGNFELGCKVESI